ncbi:zinc-dependent alcohol dehydrogenase family protein [Pseudonocardia broussonetiae]|uniref:enoyl-[acyl-carrier-protein] reductase n=1 Tax=Pseudonocardia broussonetiae TaxID=2736640 RepID=A0A6M6JRI7_9PSEU|nr:zinc-dependent alcohol dehydrogenase family protein [Pseudonocardia broussonetiae]QJY49617.1 zinc-dependent alcohol dehydrogenase family protein [Pseudonocardia broussonetiae]
MKALQLKEFGKPTVATELIESPAPEPGPGQLLVAMEASPINPSDLLLIRGRYGHRPALPAVPGTEGVGRVVAAGHGVDPGRVGERVIVPTVAHGTWQDQLVIDDGGAIAVDPAADVLQSAMLGINPITADLLLRSFVDLSPGAWVAQTGGNSAVGRYVIALAKQAGHRTLSVVRRPEVAAELLESGADAVVVSGPDLRTQLKQVLGDERISLLLDPIAGEVVTELASWLAHGGTLVSYGGMSGTPVTVSPNDLIFRDLTVRGFWLKHWLDTTPHDAIVSAYARLAPLVADGSLRAPVAATYPLEEFQDALLHASQPGGAGKVLFTW